MQRAQEDGPGGKKERDRRQEAVQPMWQIKEMIGLMMLAICTYTDIKLTRNSGELPETPQGGFCVFRKDW